MSGDSYIPLFLKANAYTKVVIVGGGDIAHAKAESLLASGASISVIAPKINPELVRLLEANNASYQNDLYDKKYLAGASLVVAATSDKPLNAAIHSDCKTLGILVNVVDQPELCDVIFPAVVRRGKIQIAISTSGVSPVLARHIKYSIERLLPWNLEEFGKFLESKRAIAKKIFANIKTRRLFWEEVLASPIPEEVMEGNFNKAEELFESILQNNQSRNKAALYLIGAGPGNPDLITIKGTRLLNRADVVLYDRLVAPALLDMYARRDALKIPVGKARSSHLKSQDEINELIEEHLSDGKIVARLKGGDPGIYAHATEEIAAAKRCGAVYQIVPGITAATGCAATAGIPLTERGVAQAVRFLTFYKDDMLDEDFWQTIKFNSKETLVFYMTSHHRAWLMGKLRSLGFPGDIPVVAIEQGTTPFHAEYEATIETFAENFKNHQFISPTLLIVGEVARWRHLNHWKEENNQKQPFFEDVSEAYVV